MGLHSNIPVQKNVTTSLFAGAPSGANTSALLYTLIETAKACGLEPIQYLCDLFTKIPL